MYSEAFKIAQVYVNQNIFQQKNAPILQTANFRNIFIAAIYLKKYEWAEKFIKEYINYIDEDLRETEFNYHMGILAFKYGRYQESLNYLAKIHIRNIYERVNIKFYCMMSYIELGLLPLAEATLKAMKQYSRQSKEVPEAIVPLIKPSLIFFNEIIKCIQDGKEPDAQLLEPTNNTKRYYHRRYIVDKFTGIAKRRKQY
jgi:tetratricopeptide (TPR) repeat protein